MDEKYYKTLEHRVEKLEDVFEAINKLTVQIEKLATETKFMREEQNKLTTRVDQLERKPEKRYDLAINTIITGVVGAIIGAIMALIMK